MTAITDKDVLQNITGLTADSRNVAKGFLFAAFPGNLTDGRLFISQAIEEGARYILAPTGTILSEDDSEKALLIEDENPRLRFALLAAAFYPEQPTCICAVTGTSGKTSTANFTAQLWNLRGQKAASLGTLGILTPDGKAEAGLTTMASEDLFRTLSKLKTTQNIDHIAMEASSIGIEQYRMHGVRVRAAAFTNLSRDHLDYHKDMEDYFSCKMRLFTELLDKDGTAVICTDDEWGARLYKYLCENFTGCVWSYGYNGQDIRLNKQILHANGQTLNIHAFGKDYDLDLPLAGSFQGVNALAALGLILGACEKSQTEDIIALLPQLTSVPGRMEGITGHPKGAGIIIDYAHKPGALKTVLETLRPHVKGRLICLFGCGGNRDKGKRPEMGAIAAKYSDYVIVTDDNPRHEDPTQIRSDIIAGLPDGCAYEDIPDRAAAILAAITSLEDGDVLIIAGKGHEQGQTIAGVTHPFDDRTESRRVIEMLKTGA